MNSKIAIIGGTGFIGKHLVGYFIKNNLNDISLLTRNKNLKSFDKCVTLIEGNLNSRNSLDTLTNNKNIVINLAYLNSDLQTNINAIEILVESCIKSGVSKLIHFSTAIVAGRVKDKIINEETACNPFNEYEQTKLAIENKLLSLTKNKLELIILRPTAVFGQGGLNLVKTIKSNLNQPRIFSSFQLFLNSYRLMHLVSVDYVVEAVNYLITTEENLSEEIFILSMDDQKNNNYFYIANRIALISNNKMFPKRFFPFSRILLEFLLRLLGRSQIKPDQIYSNQKIKKYGFSCELSFENSIDEFIKSTIK